MDKLRKPLVTAKGFGLGLGLCVVEKIMQQHEGEPDIRPQPGKGACFTLWFPLSKMIDKAAWQAPQRNGAARLFCYLEHSTEVQNHKCSDKDDTDFQSQVSQPVLRKRQVGAPGLIFSSRLVYRWLAGVHITAHFGKSQCFYCWATMARRNLSISPVVLLATYQPLVCEIAPHFVLPLVHSFHETHRLLSLIDQ
jgi:hypothetical protein